MCAQEAPAGGFQGGEEASIKGTDVSSRCHGSGHQTLRSTKVSLWEPHRLPRSPSWVPGVPMFLLPSSEPRKNLRDWSSICSPGGGSAMPGAWASFPAPRTAALSPRVEVLSGQHSWGHWPDTCTCSWPPPMGTPGNPASTSPPQRVTGQGCGCAFILENGNLTSVPLKPLEPPVGE